MLLIRDKKYDFILAAYDMLSSLSINKVTEVEVHRSYIDDESVKLNFTIFNKRYLLVVPADAKLNTQIWHSHNKTNSLVKESYSLNDISSGKFVKE